MFEVEDDWVDDTGYQYHANGINVVIGPYAKVDTYRAKMEEALERFRLSVPAYELVERREIDKPAPGAELVSMRVGAKMSIFEMSIFWPIGDVVWVFRSRGKLDDEAMCREAAEGFLQTYQPLEAEE
jgi:hypothetical protein